MHDAVTIVFIYICLSLLFLIESDTLMSTEAVVTDESSAVQGDFWAFVKTFNIWKNPLSLWLNLPGSHLKLSDRCNLTEILAFVTMSSTKRFHISRTSRQQYIYCML